LKIAVFSFQLELFRLWRWVSGPTGQPYVSLGNAPGNGLQKVW